MSSRQSPEVSTLQILIAVLLLAMATVSMAVALRLDQVTLGFGS
jgi:hypothetical protein